MTEQAPACVHGKNLITADCPQCRQETGTGARILRTDPEKLKD